MHFTVLDWEIDTTPDLAIGMYFPHIRISQRSADGSLIRVYDSGPQHAVDTAEEALCLARKLAEEWLSQHAEGIPDWHREYHARQH
jgi:hypothetical protein